MLPRCVRGGRDQGRIHSAARRTPLLGSLLREGDDWYERGPLWQGTNLNKRDITLDLTSATGRELALRLAAEADVVVENFSPRVVEQFGLDYDSIARVNPGVIMVRMPGFGPRGRGATTWAGR